jgi:hypothetical protein
MKTTLLTIALTAASLPFAFAAQTTPAAAPASASSTAASKKTVKKAAKKPAKKAVSSTSKNSDSAGAAVVKK